MLKKCVVNISLSLLKDSFIFLHSINYSSIGLTDKEREKGDDLNVPGN